MRIRRAPSIVLGATLACLLPPAAGLAGESAPRESFITCAEKGRDADRFCFSGDDVTGVVRAFARDEVVYRQCVREKGHKTKPDCRVGVTRGPASRPRLGIPYEGPGRYLVSWFQGGKLIGRAGVRVRSRRAFVVGDSLSRGTKPYLPKTLPDWHFEQDVSISRHAPDGVELLRKRGRLPGVVVMALGTNDDPRDVAGFKDAVRDSLDEAGSSRCLVWVNIRRPPVDGVSYDGYNDVLDRFARHNDDFKVVDWHRITEEHPEVLADDGAHASQEGYVMRAVAIAKAILRC